MTKWMMEQQLADFDSAYGFRSVVFRFCNAVGGVINKVNRDKMDTVSAHIVPLTFPHRHGNMPPFTQEAIVELLCFWIRKNCR